MALFNISGSRDWAVSEIGQKLCQNFEQDNHRKKQKAKSKAHQKDTKRKLDKHGKIKNLVKNFDKTGEILNGKNPYLLTKILEKYKLSKNAEDKIPLNGSIDVNDLISAKKKSLKRKHSLETKASSKKAKKEINGQEKPPNKIPTDSAAAKSNKKTSKLITEEEPSQKIKKRKNKTYEELVVTHNDTPQTKATKIDPVQLMKRKKQLQKLQELMQKKKAEQTNYSPAKKEEPLLTLRQRMMRKLKAARFRFLNEQIYSTTSKETSKIFRQDPEAFKAYHEGYKLQVKRWPLNPLDKIIKSLSKIPKTCIIADFGCGEARLAQSLEQNKVYSFDLVAINETVTACDMAHVPLPDCSVDVGVFCLSLMGTNLKDYLMEANRVLKEGGFLKIAEVESRFQDVNAFVKDCEKFGFKKTWLDLSHNLFYFIDFKKVAGVKGKKKLPLITLQPCLYKKR